MQEFHGSIDAFLKSADTISLQDIENLAVKEENISSQIRELQAKQEGLDENIKASLSEAITIIEQSLEAVRKKMYGDFGDHAAIKTTAQKVQQMKTIIEDQIKEASNQMMAENGNSNEVITHLTDSLATGEEDIVFAQNKIKSRTTSLSKEAVRYEVGFKVISVLIIILFFGVPKH